ncbi:MAG: SpoIID/LytB domain-containing protein [Luteibaculum sp.]
MAEKEHHITQLLKYCICLLSSLFCLSAIAQDDTLLVSLYDQSKISKVFINPYQGSYILITENNPPYELQSGDWVRVSKKEGAFTVQTAYKDFGLSRKVFIKQNQASGLLKILPEEPRKVEQWYGGNLELRYTLKGIKLINRVALEEYTAGVVQAESGVEQNEEYYKVQGIICRTFAISNLDKHAAEGFNLCDQVHCQVYHGQARFPSYIKPAIKSTTGLVLVDSNLKLIDAVFHSNCGGSTVNSEDYWTAPIDYLRGREDSYCAGMPHWNWNFTLENKQWLGYLEQKFNFPVTDSVHAYNAKNWIPQERGKWFLNQAFRVPLRTIREDWRLKSTNFSVSEQNGRVVLQGTGFGHGVGLCQEGAMGRSKTQSFAEILHFYYQGVYLVDKSNVPFYRKFK